MSKKINDRIVAYAAWHPTKGFDEHHYEGPIAFADLEDDGGVIEVVKDLNEAELTNEWRAVKVEIRKLPYHRVMRMTPLQIARAWHSVQDEWIVRRNKSYAVRQWEVVHNWGRDVISEKTMKSVSRHETMEGAKSKAFWFENRARGAAVLAALTIG